MGVRNYYFFLGFIHLPPAASEMIMQATAAHEKALFFVPMPRVRKAIPRISKYPDSLRRSIFMIYPFKFEAD